MKNMWYTVVGAYQNTICTGGGKGHTAWTVLFQAWNEMSSSVLNPQIWRNNDRGEHEVGLKLKERTRIIFIFCGCHSDVLIK